MTINISTSPAIFTWRPAAWLRISGEDALSFLQGQFTNDLRMLAPGRAVYGLWLTVKGKVLADSFVVRDTAGGLWIGSYFSDATVIRERLESHVIADDVVVEDETAAWTGLSIFGPAAREWLERPPEVGVIFGGRRAREPHIEWVVPVGNESAVRNHFPDTPEIDRRAVDLRRLAAGIPAVPVEIGPADLPNEGGLEAEAISYTKGCYLGQEVMARLKSMGQVRRRLLRMRGAEGALPTSLPAPLHHGERQVGELRSAVLDGAGGWLGFAMITLLAAHGAPALSLAPNAPASVHFVDAP